MYGRLTSKRRNLAFLKRKSLKEQGLITSGYVAFPAKLMVNIPGEFDAFGKKKYTCFRNFSSDEVSPVEDA